MNAKGVSRTIGDYTVVIQDVALKANQYQVSLTLMGQNLQQDQVQSMVQLLHIADKEGHGFNLQAQGKMDSSRADLVISVIPLVAGKPPTPPDELDWPLPGQITELVQKFDLQDLPLP